MNNKVSFDFDSTLSVNVVEDYAKELVCAGFEVWIITTRNHAFYSEVKEVSDKIGILSSRIIFTSGKDKIQAIKDIKPIFHLDDDLHEINLINKESETKGITNFGNKNWKQDCEEAILNN